MPYVKVRTLYDVAKYNWMFNRRHELSLICDKTYFFTKVMGLWVFFMGTSKSCISWTCERIRLSQEVKNNPVGGAQGIVETGSVLET